MSPHNVHLTKFNQLADVPLIRKNLSVIERCPPSGSNFKNIVTFEAQHFVRYSWYVRYLGCPL